VLLLTAWLVVGLAVQGAADAELEREARHIETMLIAPCCFTQQVSVHQSEAAEEVRRDIRRRLAAGETREQILDDYVARYGTRILAEPPARGFNKVLFVIPPIALLLTAGLLFFVVRHYTRDRPGVRARTAMPAAADDRAALAARLDDELRDLD
jgi:cytochrome c-type biogenesis protein CcmH